MGNITAEGERFTDNKRIEGTIPEMLDKAMNFFKNNIKVSTAIDPQNAKRIDRYEYPLIALREAILNALIHRDYSKYSEGKPITLTIFSNRIEIKNPGGLYGRLTLDNLGKIQPDTRNPTLARALETLRITENRYSGIPTIYRELEKAGLSKPEFLDSKDEFCITIYNKIQKETIHENGKSLLSFCQIPRSREEIVQFLNLKTVSYAMKKVVNPLIEAGKLARTLPETPKSKNQKYFTVL